jgi:hypothetical protein
MAGRRSQILLARGLGVALGALLGVGLPLGCGSQQASDVTRTLVREAGSIEASPDPDPGDADAEAGVPDTGLDADPVDAGLARVLLGITPVPPNADAASPSDQTLAELSVLAVGARARALVVRFDDLVDTTGAPSDSVFADIAQTAARYRARGFFVLFAIAVVDRAKDARPVSLRASWSSPELTSSLEALIDRAYDTFGTELAYLSLGTDVDRFLAQASDDDRAASAAFIGGALSYAKAHPKRQPSTQLGVTFSASGLLGDRLPETAMLLRQSDAAIVTSDSLQASFEVTPAASAAARLGDLADAIPEQQPVVLQELSYPSSTVVGSSAAEQLKFYEAAFNVLATRRERFPFVNLYALDDSDEAECERQAAVFGAAANPLLIAARCSLGLKDGQGADKPAFSEVASALSAFGRP